MALADALAAIRSRLEDLGPALPIIGENENTPPPSPPAPWMQFEFIGASPTIAGIAAPGSHLVRTFGTVYVHVFVPRGTAAAVLDGYVDAVSAVFRTSDADDVFYDGAPRVDPAQPTSEDGAWFGRSVAVDFRTDFIA
jgi:hypothetical protein